MRKLHLICNAHLDPVWQWQQDEGAAAAISTFRVAADFCEQFDGFVFNHNEAILYKWVEEYEPSLFARIQQLVAKGRWHIMGGWYLQPDCNMPSGESLVRQILLGRAYFREKFKVEPATALNFDSFGHTRGLVQILKKSGYDSYLFCRPDSSVLSLVENDFTWVGYDGSEITGHRCIEFYNSAYGKADHKVTNWAEKFKDKSTALCLWGIGDHGGGPSRVDLEKLAVLMRETTDCEILHSTPEAYFKELHAQKPNLPRHEKDLNPFAIGCYTSQVRLKQKHRELENELYMTEKMLSHAVLGKLLEYPREQLHEAACDLLFAEFHDILPGSSVQPVEEASLRLMDHALETLSRLKTRAFFALAGGQAPAPEGCIPVLVYNPHPFPVEGVFECEFMLADQNWKDEFTLPVVHRGQERLASQPEKELSNLSLDWRKRVAFRAELAPGRMNRFDCKLEVLPAKPQPALREKDGCFHFQTSELEVVVNARTGLLDRYRVAGVDYLKSGAGLPLVLGHSDDPWVLAGTKFDNVQGCFTLMDAERGARFSGVRAKHLPSVRVIEDGEVRTVVEAVFAYNESSLCMQYKLPKKGSEVELAVRVFWNEKSQLLKLSLPTTLSGAEYLGQVAYGTATLPMEGAEVVAQKWVAAVSREKNRALTCINAGSYGSDFQNGEIRLSLLRSPAYTSHPIGTRPLLPEDRFSPRIDQGERTFRFWLNAGEAGARLTRIDREALAHNEAPLALSFFPSGGGRAPQALARLDDAAVQLTAFKKAEQSESFVIRLFEPTGTARSTTLHLPALGMAERVDLKPFEIKTLLLNPAKKTLAEADLQERPL